LARHNQPTTFKVALKVSDALASKLEARVAKQVEQGWADHRQLDLDYPTNHKPWPDTD